MTSTAAAADIYIYCVLYCTVMQVMRFLLLLLAAESSKFKSHNRIAPKGITKTKKKKRLVFFSLYSFRLLSIPSAPLPRPLFSPFIFLPRRLLLPLGLISRNWFM